MKHSLFWAAVEAGAKAARSGLSVVGALVDCGIPRQHVWAEALADLEAEEEVSEPLIERFGLKLPLSAYDKLGDSLDRITEAEQSAFRSGGQTWCTRCSQRIPQHPTGAGLCVCTPQDSRTNAGATSSSAVEETSEGASPPAAPSDVLADSWVAFAIPVIAEVLADHFAEQRFTAVTVTPYILCHHLNGDICGEFADRRDHRDHVAPLIADRLEAVTLALPEM